MRIPGITRPGQLASWCMELLPHHFLSACMYEATRCKFRPWKNQQIRLFCKYYHVDLTEAECDNVQGYADFNAFFTRSLRTEARNIAYGEQTIVCPADGRLSEFGYISQGCLLQAKGKAYSLSALLGGDENHARQFEGGRYLTVYLSPRDYHRVHMPVTGRLRQMIHVPGRLFSVNGASAANVNQLFARNERVISVFDTALGQMAVILVGALFVGNIEQVWAGQVAPAGDGDIKRSDYSHDPAIRISQGVEMGRFNMGSTVIVLLENPAIDWREELSVGQQLRLGQALARARIGS